MQRSTATGAAPAVTRTAGVQQRARVVVVMAGVGLALLEAPPAVAQAVRQITDDPCRCRVILRTTARISDAGTAGFLGPFSLLSTDSRGRYYVVSTVAPGQITATDGSGRILATIGRSGDGPGEFRSPIAPVFGMADTMYVADQSQRRLSAFDSDYRLVGTMRLAPVSTLAVANDGSLVVAGNVRTADRLGYPLHVVSIAGGVTASFGTDVPFVRPDQPARSERVIARADRGGVWSAYPRQYQIDHWSLHGTHSISLIRSADWFPDMGAEPFALASEKPPQTTIVGLWEARALLYVVMHVADAHWRPGPGIEPGKPLDFATFGGFFDTLIEVIDVARARVVASLRDDRYLRVGFPDLLYEYSEDPEGAPRITSYRVDLETQQK